MNDFIIQFYENKTSVSFFNFYELNNIANYKEYINLNESKFIFNVFNNEKRKQFIQNSIIQTTVELKMPVFIKIFIRTWELRFGNKPSAIMINEFLGKLLSGEFYLDKYAENNVKKITNEFIQGR